MSEGAERYYPLEPWVGLGDFHRLRRVSWKDLDRKAAEVLGTECLAIPSVRVGMCWALEYLECQRYRDHVLVPRFMGRCILNSLNRYALPVEEMTSRTRLVVVVHQFGLKHNLKFIQETCTYRGISYIEDSPYGLEAQEEPGPGSLAKFVGLTKILPVLKGAIVLSHHQPLLEFTRQKRSEASLWSWAVLGALALIRMRRTVTSYSALADAAYEMYVGCKGDNTWLRGNVLRALERLDSFAAAAKQRLSLLENKISERLLIPDTHRMSYVVPYSPAGDESQAQWVFRSSGFEPSLYHVDVARNLLNPRYERHLLIPLNPRIPWTSFDRLINELAALESEPTSIEAPAVEAAPRS